MTTTTKIQNAMNGLTLPLNLRQAIGLYLAAPSAERADRMRAAMSGLVLPLELRQAIGLAR